MDEKYSNINAAFTISKAAAEKFFADARSFSNKCSQAVEDKEKAHIEKMKKKKGFQDSKDSKVLERQVALYASIIHNHSLRGWFPSPYNLNQLIDLFPGLRIKKGYHLDAYQHLDRSGNGRAKIFVIPFNRALPKSPPQKALNDLKWQAILAVLKSPDNTPPWKRKLRMTSHFLLGIFLPSYRSIPKWADSKIVKYIEGDGSPQSYFQASIFLRELYELGAIWHNASWKHHIFVTSPGDILYANSFHEKLKLTDWTWHKPEPKEWCPVVWKNKAQRWNVTFHTIDMMQATLNSHTDKFIEGYGFKTSSKILASYPGGYMV